MSDVPPPKMPWAKPYGESACNRFLRQYQATAKRKSLAWELTVERFRELTQGLCRYCGIEPRARYMPVGSYGPYINNGIDRQDSTLGYTDTNCVPCCRTCNRAKSDMTMDAWQEWLERIGSRHDSR